MKDRANSPLRQYSPVISQCQSTMIFVPYLAFIEMAGIKGKIISFSCIKMHLIVSSLPNVNVKFDSTSFSLSLFASLTLPLFLFLSPYLFLCFPLRFCVYLSHLFSLSVLTSSHLPYTALTSSHLPYTALTSSHLPYTALTSSHLPYTALIIFSGERDLNTAVALRQQQALSGSGIAQNARYE